MVIFRFFFEQKWVVMESFVYRGFYVFKIYFLVRVLGEVFLVTFIQNYIYFVKFKFEYMVVVVVVTVLFTKVKVFFQDFQGLRYNFGV